MNKGYTIIIAGFPGSGKGTITSYIAKQYGGIPYRFSNPLQAILSGLGIKTSRDNFSLLSTLLRKNFGETIMGRGVLEFIRKHEGGIIVLEGVRRMASIEECREYIDLIVWIETSLETRYERIKIRGEKDQEGTISFEEFQQQDQSESESSLHEIKKIATHTIENNGSEELLYKQIDVFMKNIPLYS